MRVRGLRQLWAVMLGLGLATQAAAAPRWLWLPQGDIFRTPLAGHAESANYLSFVRFEPDGGEGFTAALTSLGLSFPFYRLEDSRVGGDWQFGLFAAAQSQFNMSEMSDPLLNTDYFVGLPLSFRNQRWSARARLFHQSSHLGDELLLSGDAPEREDLSYEAADLLVAYTLPSGWRLYAGGAYILSSDLPKLGDASGHSGIDYLSGLPVLWSGHLMLALDMLSADAFDPKIQWHGIAGLRFARQHGAGGLTLGVQAFHGPIPFGQFFDDATADFVGLIALFELR